MTYRSTPAVLVAALGLVRAALGADWITAPSYYTHDPMTGDRVTQYSPIGPFYIFPQPDYRRSGYRHTRSSIQAGQSADHMHIVEEWGRPVRPYGEWRFPYRPYSVPYPAWGAPFAGLGAGRHPFAFPPGPPHGAPGDGQPDPYGRQQPPPYYDGSYPEYRSRPPDARHFDPVRDPRHRDGRDRADHGRDRKGGSDRDHRSRGEGSA